MKQIHLDGVLEALRNPRPEQVVEIAPDIAARAKQSLDNMFELEKTGREKREQQGRSKLPWTTGLHAAAGG